MPVAERGGINFVSRVCDDPCCDIFALLLRRFVIYAFRDGLRDFRPKRNIRWREAQVFCCKQQCLLGLCRSAMGLRSRRPDICRFTEWRLYLCPLRVRGCRVRAACGFIRLQNGIKGNRCGYFRPPDGRSNPHDSNRNLNRLERQPIGCVTCKVHQRLSCFMSARCGRGMRGLTQ